MSMLVLDGLKRTEPYSGNSAHRKPQNPQSGSSGVHRWVTIPNDDGGLFQTAATERDVPYLYLTTAP